MTMTVDELLTLVGRLDDAPGFDTPRERYRRFLIERVTTVQAARALIEDCQCGVGEQRHRALQDLIVLLGRFLGFETAFGPYKRAKKESDRTHFSQWISPGLLDVVLDVRTEQTPDSDLDALAHVVDGGAAAASGPGDREIAPRIALCVVARQYVSREKLNRAVQDLEPPVRAVSVRSLVSLAERLADERIGHADVVRILQSESMLEPAIDRLPAAAPNGASSATPSDAGSIRAMPRRIAAAPAPAYWLATIIEDDRATPEQLVSSVIAERGVLGVCDDDESGDIAAPGDRVCFFLPRRGIVGDARVASILENAGAILREAARFTRVYRLADVRIYEQPVVQALRREWPFSLRASAPSRGPSLTAIAQDDFLSFTAQGEAAPASHSLTLFRTPRRGSVRRE